MAELNTDMQLKLSKEFMTEIVKGNLEKHLVGEPRDLEFTVRIDEIRITNSSPAKLQILSGNVVVFENDIPFITKDSTLTIAMTDKFRTETDFTLGY